MTETAQRIKDRLNVIQVDKDELNKLVEERNDWDYDALCMRFGQLIDEIVYLKTFSQEAKDEGHYGDYKHYKRFYGMRACRFYEELYRFTGMNHYER